MRFLDFIHPTLLSLKMTKYQFLKSILFLSLLLAVFIVAVPVNVLSAKETLDPGKEFFINDPLSLSGGKDATFGGIVLVFAVRILQGSLVLVGVLSFAIFVMAGIWWMFARGDEKMITRSKDMMKWAVIGLAVVFLSYAALQEVFSALTGVFGITQQ